MIVRKAWKPVSVSLIIQESEDRAASSTKVKVKQHGAQAIIPIAVLSRRVTNGVNPIVGMNLTFLMMGQEMLMTEGVRTGEGQSVRCVAFLLATRCS